MRPDRSNDGGHYRHNLVLSPTSSNPLATQGSLPSKWGIPISLPPPSRKRTKGKAKEKK